MKKNILFFVSLFSACLLQAQETKEVLFIGNSYTGVNNLPSLTKQVAQSMGDDVIYQTHIPGGTTLQQHAQSSALTAKINSQSWDFVTIQAQSQEPSFPTSQFNTQTLPYAEQLVDKILANDSCTQPTFYMTWGRKDGDANNCPFAPWLCTYEGMDDSLRARYEYMAEVNESLISPVGAVWRNLRNSGITFDLYTSDKSHPSIYGSYAGALSFYTIFFEKNPELVTFVPSGINATDAATIRAAAKTVVFDSLAYWNVGEFTANSNFDFDIQSDSVIFTNTSTNSDAYVWDFGNGDTSMDEHPTYVFSGNGNYQVSLISTACNNPDTLTREVVISGLNVKDITVDNVTIFPNPVKDILNINTVNYEFGNIYNVNGQLIMSFNSTNKVQVGHLNSGIYFMEIFQNNHLVRMKFIINQ